MFYEALARPFLFKLNPEQAHAMRHGVSYFVCCNTIPTQHAILGKCGKSGRPLKHIAKRGVAALYQLLGKTAPIIGTGGIFCADDAIDLIEAGASLVQIYTGFVYKGPSLFCEINCGLAAKVHSEGITNISEIVGRSHQKVLREAYHE